MLNHFFKNFKATTTNMSQSILIGQRANDPNDTFFLFGVNTDEWYKEKMRKKFGNGRDYFDEQGNLKTNVREALQKSIKRGIDEMGGNDDMQFFVSDDKFNCDEGIE